MKEATDGYYAQLNEINARVSSFNLETIAEAWDSSLQGYMPEIEGSTKEKLETALNNALLAHPDVQTWTAADVASWMGLDKLNLDTAVQTDIATQILQTALAVPDGTKEKIMQDFKDSVPTAEEIKEAIDWDSMTNEDWTELMESITGPTEGESIGLNTEDLKKKMSDYYGEYFESVKTSYSEALHNALENSGSEETLSTFMQQYMQDQMADFDFSTVMENYGPISNEYFATLQSEWQTAGTNLGTSLNTGASTSLTNGSAGLRTSLQTSLNTATASPFSISPTVNVTPKYNLLTLPTIPTTTSTPAKHAAGGRVGGGPQLSWLAEEGWDEFVIPTNPSRRTRALELYEQAGEALGVSKHAEGGRIESSNLSDMVSDHNLFTEATRNASYGYNDTTEGNYEDNSAETFAPVSSEVPVSTPQTGPISVNVAVSPNFQIEAKEGQSEEDIVAVIRRHLGEIADELGGNLGWEENDGELSVRTSFVAKNDKTSKGYLSKIIKPGCLVGVFATDGASQDEEVARGYVETWNPVEKSGGHTLKCTCYDELYKLQKSQDNRYFPSGTGTKSAIEGILDDWEIPQESYQGPNASHGKTVENNKYLSDIIINLLDDAAKKGEEQCFVQARKGKTSVIPRGSNKTVYVFRTDNTQMFSQSISTADMITRVKVVGKADDDGRTSVEATVNGETKYGIRQRIYTRGKDESLADAKSAAQEILDDEGKIKKEIKVQSPDVPFVRKGDLVYVMSELAQSYYGQCDCSTQWH